MDSQQIELFSRFLKRGGRSPQAVERCVSYVEKFETYLLDWREKQNIANADYDDLESFVFWIETDQNTSAKGFLWALRYYFEFVGNHNLSKLSAIMREQRVERKPFLLKEFKGVDPQMVDRLNSEGIYNIDQMLESGSNPQDRAKLVKGTGIPEESVLEFVKLSDLARIPGIKGIRARLYYDAGVDTVEKMASYNPDVLRQLIEGFVKQTCFDGIVPLPAEINFSVNFAKGLPKIIK